MTVEPELRSLAADVRGRLEAVLDELGDGITVQGRSGELLYANDSAARLSGLSSAAELLRTPVDEIVGRFELFDEHGRPLGTDALPGRLALRGERPPERLVRFRVRESGVEQWSVVHAMPVLDEGGRVLYAINIFRDVTARYEAERERKELLAREQEARAEAERAAETVRKLEGVTQAALKHIGTGTLLDELLLQILRVVKADTCAILLLDDERRFLTVRAARGFDAEIEAAVPIPFGEGMAGQVAASGKPVLIDDLSSVELASPHLRERGINSLVAIPIATEDRVIGVAHAGSTQPRYFGDEDVRLLGLMADRIALAVTQARLYEAERSARRDAEEAHGRLSFLAEASTILSSSLDYESTLQVVARLVVPHLADWCAVDVTDSEERLARIAVAHAALPHDELLHRAGQLRPPEPGDPVGPFAVLRRGSSELAPDVPDDILGSLGGDVAGAEALRQLGFASYMCVPLHGRDRVLGTITVRVGRARPLRRGRPRAGRGACTAGGGGGRERTALPPGRGARPGSARARGGRATASSSSTVAGSFASGTLRPRRSPVSSAAEVVGRLASEGIPGWAAVADRVPVVRAAAVPEAASRRFRSELAPR